MPRVLLLDIRVIGGVEQDAGALGNNLFGNRAREGTSAAGPGVRTAQIYPKDELGVDFLALPVDQDYLDSIERYE